MSYIRRIEAEDWPEYRRLRLEGLNDSPLAFVEQYDEAIELPDESWQERTARLATAPDIGALVAFDREGGPMTGTMACMIEPEFTDHVSAQLISVYVTPSHRGTGLARALLRTTLAWVAAQLRPDRLRLHVMVSNQRARTFYARSGFVETGNTMPYPPDHRLTEVEMVHPA